VKDAVEGLGVPHTEVGLVVVDGAAVGFDHRLADGERVAVYPPLRALAVPEAPRLRPEPPRPVRFVADIHLLALARRLRMLGLDALAGPGLVDDDVLARTAVEGGRVLLSRDRGLLKRRAVVHGALVRADDPQDQLVEVVRRFDLLDALAPFTRCMACNGGLRPVPPVEVAAEVPPRAWSSHDAYARCDRCRRVYWEGSHHARLTAALDDVRRRAALPAGGRGRRDGAPHPGAVGEAAPGPVTSWP
jgi:hypothetical protein